MYAKWICFNAKILCSALSGPLYIIIYIIYISFLKFAPPFTLLAGTARDYDGRFPLSNEYIVYYNSISKFVI
jgi:hypothetical protein